MALSDIFTGGAYKDAAAAQRQYLAGVSAQQQALFNQARQAGLSDLTTGATNAIGAIQPAIATGRQDISTGLGGGLGALYGGQDVASQALTGAVDPAITALYGGAAAARGAYDPLGRLSGQYGRFGYQASQAQADALGLNGPEGVARAQQQFQAGPGFQFALGTGIDALTRAANVGGMLASGNTLRQAQTFGQGLGQQEWNNYVNNLYNRMNAFNPLAAQTAAQVAAGQASPAMTAGTTAANIYGNTGINLANLLSGTGTKAAGLIMGGAGTLADLSKVGGLASADVYQTEAARQAALEQALATGQSTALSQIAGPYASTYGAEAAATTAGAGNLLKLGLGGLNLAGGLGFLPTGPNYTGGGGQAPQGGYNQYGNYFGNLFG